MAATADVAAMAAAMAAATWADAAVTAAVAATAAEGWDMAVSFRTHLLGRHIAADRFQWATRRETNSTHCGQPNQQTQQAAEATAATEVSFSLV